jgi:hypothetical protein
MAKDHSKADEWCLWLDTADNWASPTWAQIKAFVDPNIDPEKADIEITPQNEETGHLQGPGNPMFGFTIQDDKGDANVQTILDALESGEMVHLAISRGNIATAGVMYFHMECVLFGARAASRGSVASSDIEARRHANSDHPLTKATVPA